jgi:glycosyltransferase involved in cell wall biosynthesis
MEIINFLTNIDSISKQAHIESVLLYGNPEAVTDAVITICIPTYKRCQFLRDAIESVVNQITNIPYKIIVVDNDPNFNNTENLNIVKSYKTNKLSYYKNKENLSMYGNMNRCIFLANTRWVALLHDDDLLMKDYVEEISRVLHKYGRKIHGLHLRYKAQDYPFLNNFPQPPQKKIFIYRVLKYLYYRFVFNKTAKINFTVNLFYQVELPTCGILFRRDTFLESGGFNPEYYPTSDWAFFIYYARCYNFYKFRKTLGIYRYIDDHGIGEEILETYKKNRKQYLLSLKENSMLCRFLMFILKKDFGKIMDSRTEKYVETSTLFKLFQLFYQFFMI